MEEMGMMEMDDEALGLGEGLMLLLTWVLMLSGPDLAIAPLRIPVLVPVRDP